MNNIQTSQLPPRQRESYPTVAQIRKGKPKIKVTKKGERGEYTTEQLAPNADLKNKFRVHFLPGTDDKKALWHQSHAQELVTYPENSTIPTGYEVERFHVIIPTANIWNAWRYGNTANNAGREIARANHEQYLFKRDPNNGKYIVRDGLPYTPFVPGEVIEYENKQGKKIALEMKSNGVLRLASYEMVLKYGQLVEFELRTTSFYDCQQITSQLLGIQRIADTVNGGNASGIPLVIYRMAQEILWNHDDGTATRPKHWLINIQADPEWVKNIFARMGQRALTGGEAGYLPAPQSVQGVGVDPNKDFEDSVAEDEYDDEYEGLDHVTEGVEVGGKLILTTKPIPKDKQFTELFDPHGEIAVKIAAKEWNLDQATAAKELWKLFPKGTKSMTKQEIMDSVREGKKV